MWGGRELDSRASMSVECHDSWEACASWRQVGVSREQQSIFKGLAKLKYLCSEAVEHHQFVNYITLWFCRFPYQGKKYIHL
jgi:hypothetical protein